MHETHRVYGDKLIDDKDIDNFIKLQFDALKKNFDVSTIFISILISYVFFSFFLSMNNKLFKKKIKEVEEVSLLEKPNIYCHFGQGFGEPKYTPVTKWSTITQLLQEALISYNDLIAGMNLVLFEDAMMNICRYVFNIL